MKKILFFYLFFITAILNGINIKFLSPETDLIKLEITFDYNQNFDVLPLTHSIDEDYIIFDDIKIPFYKANFIIPDFDSLQMTYKIDEINYQNLSYVYSDFVDTLKSVISKNAVKISEPFILRDFRGITLNFFPFHIENQDEWKIITKISITIQSKNPFGKNPLKFHHDSIPFYFDAIYDKFFANYSDFKNDNIVAEKMIIIAPNDWDDLASQYADIKTTDGIACTRYSYPEDTGYSTDEIRNFILNKYEEDSALSFVTIIGDETLIPTNKDSLQYDKEYSFLEGDDSLPEVAIGRLYFREIEDFEDSLLKNDSKTSDKMLFAGDFSNILKEDIHTDILPKQTDYKLIFCNPDNYESINNLMTLSQIPYFISGFSDVKKNQYRFNKIYAHGLFKIFQNNLYLNNNFLFYSQIYMFFSLFHNSGSFINLQDVSDKIILDENEICKTNYTVDSYQPFSLNVKATKDFKPLANNEIFLISDGDIIASEYSDNFGDVNFSLDHFDKPFVQLGSYNKFCGFNYNFISTKEAIIVADTTNINIKCFPNPFYPIRGKKNIANISYEIKKESFVTISIYNMVGQMVKSVYSGLQLPAQYTINWDGKDNNDRYVTSGIYYVMIKNQNNTKTAKILLIK